MNQKTKLITLGVLLVVLAIVATVVLTGQKRRTAAKRPAGARPAVASRAGTAPSKASPRPADLPVPADPDVAALDAWLGYDLGDAPITLARPQVFGLPLPEGGSSGVGLNNAIPGAMPFEEPPKLEGVLWRGNAGRALIDGAAYGVGDRVAGTSFHVAALSRCEVMLQTREGREVRVDLLSSDQE
jgi:hypothetical protein